MMIPKIFASKWLAGLVVGCAVLVAQSTAAILPAGNSPFSAAVGEQADGNTPPYTESVTLGGPVTITKFSWWGYYSADSDPINNPDAFIINGTVLNGAGVFTRTDTLTDVNGLDLYLYELSLTNSIDYAGGTFDIELINNNTDFEWFWQGSTADGGPRAYLIEGTDIVVAVPEPGSLALIGLALVGMGFVQARSRKSR